MRRCLFIIVAVAVNSGCLFDHTLRWNELNGDAARIEHHLLGEMPPSVAPVGHIQVDEPALPPPLTPENYKDAPERPMTLSEAVSIAVENSEIVRTVSGPGEAALSATAYDPVIEETQVRQALAAFDTQLKLSQNWEKVDHPVDGQFDRATFRSVLERNLITGTRLSLGLDTDYFFRPGVGPASYDSVLRLGVTQPLLRGAGVTFNRAPLIIARAQARQSIWTFHEALQAEIRAVCTAYRDLYAAQESWSALDETVTLAKEIVRVQRERLGAKAAVEADVAQAESTLQTFEQQRLELVTEMLANETLLRNLIGMPPGDGLRIVASDPPSQARLIVDWESTLPVALDYRPDIARSRLVVLVREQLLIQARNGLMPQLDLVALLRANGEDSALDDALREVGSGRFTDGLLGFALDMPLRNHAAGANTQSAELSLSRERATLRQTVHAATHQLTIAVRDIDAFYAQYQAAAARMRAAETFREGSKARFENPRADSELLLLLSLYLSALSDRANATINVNRLLSQYGVAQVRLAEAKGTLLQEHDIYVSDQAHTALPTGLYDQYLRPTRFRRRALASSATPVGGIPVLGPQPFLNP